MKPVIETFEDGWARCVQSGPAILKSERCRATARSRKLMRKYALKPTTITFWFKAPEGILPTIRVSARTGQLTVYLPQPLAADQQLLISQVQQEYK